MSTENHHALAAGSILAAANASELGWETADAQHIAAHIEASVEATLALAYEQRTANLIALYGAKDLENGLTAPQWADTLKQIKERLDLA